MSEFKFACPVCGQHITVDAGSSGSQMDCPTCFRKIVVPQAPSGQDSKLLLSAAQPAQPRPTPAVPGLEPLRRPSARGPVLTTLLLLAGLCAAGAVLYSFRGVIGRAFRGGRPVQDVQAPATNAVVPVWTLDPAQAVIPEQGVSGRLHGAEFACEKVLFAGGVLSFRKGPGWPPDLGLDIVLSASKADQLSGKNIIIAPGARSVVSKVVLRWKDSQNRPQQAEVASGFALTLLFGQRAGDRLHGRLHIALPDPDKSCIAGTFEAEILHLRPSGK